MRSIIIDDLNICFVCNDTQNIELHHCIHGTAGRKLATKYHLVVGLCPDCHRGTDGVHGKHGHKLDMVLKKIAQRAWEGKHGDRNEFIKIFGKSYM